MEARLIRTEEDYNRALAEFERYFDNEPAPGSREGDRFEVLGVLLRAYEDRHWPIGSPGDPVEVLQFAIESMGRSQAELGDLLGSRPRASEILARKRALTVEMIDKISSAWRIPVELLAKPYRLEVDRLVKRAFKTNKARGFAGSRSGSFKATKGALAKAASGSGKKKMKASYDKSVTKKSATSKVAARKPSLRRPSNTSRKSPKSRA
jgi:HTH-type transcriptional regulator / antitoxin HigA